MREKKIIKKSSFLKDVENVFQMTEDRGIKVKGKIYN